MQVMGKGISKKIIKLKLELAVKRMHDPKGFFPGLFTQARLKNTYIHETEPYDQMFQRVHSF